MLTCEKSRLLFLMMFVMARHQRYVQAGLVQLATVAEYYASATESRSRGGPVPPADSDDPYYPVGLVRLQRATHRTTHLHLHAAPLPLMTTRATSTCLITTCMILLGISSSTWSESLLI